MSSKTTDSPSPRLGSRPVRHSLWRNSLGTVGYDCPEDSRGTKWLAQCGSRLRPACKVVGTALELTRVVW